MEPFYLFLSNKHLRWCGKMIVLPSAICNPSPKRFEIARKKKKVETKPLSSSKCNFFPGVCSCLSEPPRTWALPGGHGLLSSVTHLSLWKPGPAAQSQIWLPEGPLPNSEPISKQGKRPDFRQAQQRERSRARWLSCLCTSSSGYMSPVRGQSLSRGEQQWLCSYLIILTKEDSRTSMCWHFSNINKLWCYQMRTNEEKAPSDYNPHFQIFLKKWLKKIVVFVI